MTNLQKTSEEFHWQGRIDAAEGDLARRWHQCVRTQRAEVTRPDIALIGFAVDEGVARNQGRIGAALGPNAIRRALSNMAWHHGENLVFDAGDVHCHEQDLATAQTNFGAQVRQLLASGFQAVGLGGGHEIAFASWQGIAAHLASSAKTPRIGIINFDAHFDLRIAEHASSGTPFKQIADDCAVRGWDFHYACLGVAQSANTQALFATAKALNVWWELDHAVQEVSVALQNKLAAFIAGNDYIYLSICLDVLPAAHAPGVSAPAGFGVPLAVLMALIAQIKASGKLLYCDIAELNPNFDIDQRTAKVAARLVWGLSMPCHSDF
jgi:formiminoglutamase